MKPIKLGHVGTLHDHSGGKLLCVKKFPELFEIVGVVAESPEREEEIKSREPYAGLPFCTRETLLSRGVEAVLVETHEHQLVREAQFWADHGVHLHVDKPAGNDVQSLEKLLRTAKAGNLTVQTAYMYRYNHAIRDCLARVERGELGDVYQVTAIMNTRHAPDKRAWLKQFKGGIQFYLGCHMIDLICLLQGLPEKIYPFLKSTMTEGVDAIDWALALFEYPNGISAAEATAVEVNGYGRRQLVVCGTKGTYEIEPLENPSHAYFIPLGNATTYADRRGEEIALPPYDPLCRYEDMMKDFARFVRGKAENPFSFTYELTLQKLLLYCCGNTDVDWKTVTEI
ncbi:MAG: Gfo/Idh/MocA family oxidoreductase [Clostridia bacterium]|nr:Gfo/Idh/MocA family oxidoreductase [Clostridia bacterium]